MNVRDELIKKGCIYEGHFVGVSGKHLSGYCNIDPFLPHVTLLSEVSKLLVEPFAKDGVHTVAAPAVGAIPLSHWGAFHLEKLTKSPILGVWADKIPDAQFDFERGGFSEAIKGKRVLILEDMINQMASVKKMVALVEESGGTVAGVASIAANKGASAMAMGVPKFISLADVHYDVWTPEECMKKGLCSQNKPIVIDVGHGSEFQAANPKYPGGYTKILK